MPIIANIGRKKPAPAALIGFMYTCLVIGGITMVYPFLIWLSKGFSSEADVYENVVCPRYFHDDNALFRKYLNVRYATGGITVYNGLHGARYNDFTAGDLMRSRQRALELRIEHLRRNDAAGGGDPAARMSLENLEEELIWLQRWQAIRLPDDDPPLEAARRRLGDVADFLADLRQRTPRAVDVLFRTTPGLFSLHPVNSRYQAWLREQPWLTDATDDVGRLAILQARYRQDYESLNDVVPPREMPQVRTWTPDATPWGEDWAAFKDALFAEDPGFFTVVGEDYRGMLLTAMGSVQTCNAVLGTDYENINEIRVAPRAPGSAADSADWYRLLRELPPARVTDLDLSRIRERFERFLRLRFDDDVARLNLALGSAHGGFGSATEDMNALIAPPAGRALFMEFLEQTVDADLSVWLTLDRLRAVRDGTASPDVAELASVMRRHLERVLWAAYARRWAPARMIEIHDADARWTAFLRGWFAERQARLDRLALERGEPSRPVQLLLSEADARTWLPAAALERCRRVMETGPDGIETRMVAVTADLAGEVAWRAEASDARELTSVIYAFIAAQPVEALTLVTPDFAYQRFLLARHGTIEAIRAAHGIAADSLDAVRIPYGLIEKAHFLKLRDDLKRQFMRANFTVSLDFLAGRGNALWNTIILICASLLAGLTVNPLCAYALSRFKLPYSHNILLFCLATMAFPGEVTAIPNFLMIKELGLLNTYWALILPGLANGFSIFILKGFYDSLPQELFEAGTIDGATEWQMFYRVAMPLCKPVLAVSCLGIFLGAYAAWFFAIIICQDPQMWTIAVFLYQFYDIYRGAPQIATAAQILASIPIFIVFVLAQRVILRGIVIPQMK